MVTLPERCTCGTALTVIGRMRDGHPITKCGHCDVPVVLQTDHEEPCGRCYRYDHHVSRIFPKTA